MSRRALRCSSSRRPGRTSPPRSPRITSSSTATRCSRAGSGRICIACRWRSARKTARHCAATSGGAKFFLGTDSAPHPVKDKECDCGCAGIFSAPNALEVYARVFDEENALDKLEAFASVNGAHFYRMPVNRETTTLVRREQEVPREVAMVRPFLAGEKLGWRI